MGSFSDFARSLSCPSRPSTDVATPRTGFELPIRVHSIAIGSTRSSFSSVKPVSALARMTSLSDSFFIATFESTSNARGVRVWPSAWAAAPST